MLLMLASIASVLPEFVSGARNLNVLRYLAFFFVKTLSVTGRELSELLKASSFNQIMLYFALMTPLMLEYFRKGEYNREH